MSDAVKEDYLRNQAIWYIKQWILTPYIYGGDDFLGADCNHIAHEFLQSIGLELHKADSTAHDLYMRFKDSKVETGYAGCLVFWLVNGEAKHVDVMIDCWHIIGAIGGTKKTESVNDAVKHNAYVKMRPLEYRGLNYKICDPFKGVKTP